MSNNYLSYTSRDFDSIKNDLINAIPSMTNLWTSRDQADPGMVLITLMSALGDNLSFNLDKMSLEFFGRTVTQRKNAQYIFDLIGYKMHWYKSGQLELTISNISNSILSLLFNITNTNNNQKVTSTQVPSAPSYILLNSDESPINWDENVNISIPAGKSRTFKAIQGSIKSINFNSSSIDENNRYYLPVSKIDQDHIWLQDSNRAYRWYITDNIDELTETLPRFEFNVDEFNLPYIEFVPYWREQYASNNNITPDNDIDFTLYYVSTLGSSGNLTKDILNNVRGLSITDISITHRSNVYETSYANDIPGKDPETAREAYLNTRNLIGTYNTLVTIPDFERFFLRLPSVSNVIAIDGQRAEELNKFITNNKNKISYISLGVDPKTGLYEVYERSEKDKPYDANKFKPYELQSYLIFGNFLETDPLDSTLQYAKSKPVTPEYDSNKGYYLYIPQSATIGTTDSLISNSRLDDYKLISCYVTYAPVRKFPFFVNGKIYLTQPCTPAEASAILRNVYNAIFLNFTPQNLEIGKKVSFKDIIDVVSDSDSNIDYFDAGANNDNNNLIVYPTTDNYNPLDIDDNGNILKYAIDVDPKYFNPVSLNHYEDLIPSNNSFLYFTHTLSGNLSIAEECISEKIIPDLSNNVRFSVYKTINDNSSNDYNLSVIDTLDNELNYGLNMPLGVGDLLEYAILSEVTTTTEPSLRSDTDIQLVTSNDTLEITLSDNSILQTTVSIEAEKTNSGTVEIKDDGTGNLTRTISSVTYYYGTINYEFGTITLFKNPYMIEGSTQKEAPEKSIVSQNSDNCYIADISYKYGQFTVSKYEINDTYNWQSKDSFNNISTNVRTAWTIKDQKDSINDYLWFICKMKATESSEESEPIFTQILI